MIGSERNLNNQSSSSSSQSQTVIAGGASSNNGGCWSSSTVAPSMSGFNVYGNGSSSSSNTSSSSLSASLMGPSLIMGTPLQQSAGMGGVNHQPMGGVNHHTMGGVNYHHNLYQMNGSSTGFSNLIGTIPIGGASSSSNNGGHLNQQQHSGYSSNIIGGNSQTIPHHSNHLIGGVIGSNGGNTTTTTPPGSTIGITSGGGQSNNQNSTNTSNGGSNSAHGQMSNSAHCQSGNSTGTNYDEAVKYAAEANAKANLDKDYYEAIKLYGDAISIDGTDHRFYLNRSYCYAQLELYQLALDDAIQAISLNPNLAKCYFRKGQALAGMKKYREAEQSFLHVLTLEPDCSETRHELFLLKLSALSIAGYNDPICEWAANKFPSIDDALNNLYTLINNPATAGIINASGILSSVSSGVTNPLSSGIANPLSSGVTNPLSSGIMNSVSSSGGQQQQSRPMSNNPWDVAPSSNNFGIVGNHSSSSSAAYHQYSNQKSIGLSSSNQTVPSGGLSLQQQQHRDSNSQSQIQQQSGSGVGTLTTNQKVSSSDNQSQQRFNQLASNDENGGGNAHNSQGHAHDNSSYVHNNMFNGATLGSGLGNELNRSRDPFGVLLSNQDGGNNLAGTTSGSTILHKDQSSSAHNLLNAQNGAGSNKQGGMGVANILYEQFNSMKLSPAITPPSSGNHSAVPIGSIGNHSTLPIGSGGKSVGPIGRPVTGNNLGGINSNLGGVTGGGQSLNYHSSNNQSLLTGSGSEPSISPAVSSSDSNTDTSSPSLDGVTHHGGNLIPPFGGIVKSSGTGIVSSNGGLNIGTSIIGTNGKGNNLAPCNNSASNSLASSSSSGNNSKVSSSSGAWGGGGTAFSYSDIVKKKPTVAEVVAANNAANGCKSGNGTSIGITSGEDNGKQSGWSSVVENNSIGTNSNSNSNSWSSCGTSNTNCKGNVATSQTTINTNCKGNVATSQTTSNTNCKGNVGTSQTAIAASKRPTNIWGYNGLRIANVSATVSKSTLHSIFSKFGRIKLIERINNKNVDNQLWLFYDNDKSPVEVIAKYQGSIIPGVSINSNTPLKFFFAATDDQKDLKFSRPKQPLDNRGECYYWRTTNCFSRESCTLLHIPACKNIDAQVWMKMNRDPASSTPNAATSTTQAQS